MDEVNSYLYIKAKDNELTIEDIKSIEVDLMLNNMMNRSIYFGHIKQYELIVNNFDYENIGFNELTKQLKDLHNSSLANNTVFMDLIIKTGHVEVIRVCKELSIEYRTLV